MICAANKITRFIFVRARPPLSRVEVALGRRETIGSLTSLCVLRNIVENIRVPLTGRLQLPLKFVSNSRPGTLTRKYTRVRISSDRRRGKVETYLFRNLRIVSNPFLSLSLVPSNIGCILGQWKVSSPVVSERSSMDENNSIGSGFDLT